jgi:Restriction endonuclease S subunits
MSNWKLVKLSTLCQRIGDGLHGTPKYENNGEVYFINGNNLKNGFIVLDSDTKRVSNSEFLRNYIELNENTLLLGINGTLGNMAFYRGEKIMLGKSSAYLNFKSDINKFFYYYFQLPSVQKYFYDVATGSTIKNLSLKSLQDFEVPKPEPEEYRKIAAVLSALDDKIELNNKINAELEAMAKTLYDYWFVQFEFPNADGKPYKSSGGKMVYNETLKREIPEGWEDCTLGDISNLVRGVSYNKQDIQSEIHEDTIKILRATNITKNIIDLNDPILVSNSFVKEEQVLKPFDILITMSSGSIDHIGKNGFYYFDEKVAFGAFCAKIQMDELFRYYIYLYMQSNVFSSTIKNECLGTNINNLNGSMVKGFKHIKPSKYILERFNSLVEPCFKKIRVNIKQNQELATLRDWLLPMLMNGQVRVE